MDALIRAEGGQSLVVAALFAGVAALAITLVQDTQERLVSDTREQRIGEAAAAAAGSAVADLEFALFRSLGRPLTTAEIGAFAAEDRVADAARTAARRMSETYGETAPLEVAVRSFGVEVEVHLTLRGRLHIVLLAPPA